MSVTVLVPSTLERARLVVGGSVQAPTLRLIGVGPVAAALGAAEALRSARAPDGAPVLLVGIAGSLDPARAPIGALLVATGVSDEAVGAGEGAAFRPLARLGLPAEDSTPYELPCTCDPLRAALPHARCGELAMVATTAASPAEARARHARRPAALAEEMEGYSVALACARAGRPLSILRAVSNVAGERDKRRWDLESAFAALAAALPAAVRALEGARA